MITRKTSLMPAGAATMLGVASTFGAGFDLPDQDAFVIGRGMAFVATADNPSAIYFNPAGLTQLQGNNLRVGVYAIDLEAQYTSPTGHTVDNQNRLHAIPQFYYAYTPESSPLTFGLGVFAPFGLGQKWPQDSGFRTVGTEGSLNYYTANPVVALKVAPTVSIAAGLTVNYADLDLQQGLLWPAQPFDKFEFEGSGWAVGYNLGVLWQPLEQLSFGATFRSAATLNLQGHTDFYNTTAFPPGVGVVPAFPEQRVDASTTDPIPLKTIVGVSYRPTPKWNLEFDADYTDWRSQDTMTLHQASGFPPLLAQNLTVPLHWQSSWYYEFGATRYFENGWHVSAGYIFNENSIPDAHYNPLETDLDRHFFSVGAGYRGKRFDVDVAYQFGYGPTRTVRGSVLSAAGQSPDGDYDFMSHAIAVSVGYRF